jgi:hypothetical protein
VTAAMLNTHVRDNLNFLNTAHGVSVYKSANQTVPSGNTDVVTFNTELFDTDAYHDTVTNNSRLIVPAGLGGIYMISFKAQHDADAANHNAMGINIRLNAAGNNATGTLLETVRGTGHTNIGGIQLVTYQQLSAGDYVEGFFISTSEARDVTGSDQSNTRFTMLRMGA